VGVWNIRMALAGQDMTLAEHYSMLAARFRAKANGEKSPTHKAEWEQLADCYDRLAERPQQTLGDPQQQLSF
jgi:hypothetical protein